MECIRVHWVTKGTYMPKPIDIECGNPLIEQIAPGQIIVYDIPLSNDNWYEAKYFKIISEVK